MVQKTEIKLTCGDCVFYKDLIHPSEKFSCQLAGYLEYANPCSNFCYNTNSMPLLNTDNPELISYIRRVPRNKINEVAALLIQDGYNRNYGWSIGDIGYFNLGKSDYLSSYVQVVFKGLAGNLELAIVEGSKYKDGTVWQGFVKLESLLKPNQFAKKRKELQAEGKIKDDCSYIASILPNYIEPTEEDLRDPEYTPSEIVRTTK